MERGFVYKRYCLCIDIEKTILELDHVVGFYNVSTEVDRIIKEGPTSAQGLDHFLNALDRLKQAQSYFEKHNPQSIELENVVCITYYIRYFIS